MSLLSFSWWSNILKTDPFLSIWVKKRDLSALLLKSLCFKISKLSRNLFLLFINSFKLSPEGLSPEGLSPSARLSPSALIKLSIKLSIYLILFSYWIIKLFFIIRFLSVFLSRAKLLKGLNPIPSNLLLILLILSFVPFVSFVSFVSSVPSFLSVPSVPETFKLKASISVFE